MIRVRANLAHIKRTLRPLYAWTQATPASVFLDPAWDRSLPIWPGMVLSQTAGETVSLIGAGGVPYGLAGDYVGGDGFDPLLDVGVNATSVWIMGSDAQFEVLSPAFDDTQAWTEPNGTTERLVYAITAGTGRGKLALATNGAVATAISTLPVGRLLKVNSPSKITIGGLR
ncbi:hypothetical protein [Streptomyces sp. RLB1-9]|uniref:hypothetical protein n=1 Tax=Streptomyces sp. RLB1-9 TaxID=2594454 RepID=UPI0013DAA8EA|nr:hypothetical protein [Streptomyces sp. RLB1-9]